MLTQQFSNSILHGKGWKWQEPQLAALRSSGDTLVTVPPPGIPHTVPQHCTSSALWPNPDGRQTILSVQNKPPPPPLLKTTPSLRPVNFHRAHSLHRVFAVEIQDCRAFPGVKMHLHFFRFLFNFPKKSMLVGLLFSELKRSHFSLERLHLECACLSGFPVKETPCL